MPAKYQRRHYRQLASMIADLRLTALDAGDLYMLDTVSTFQDRLMDVFRRDNPLFSDLRFAEACEAQSAKPKPQKRTV